MDPTNPSNDTAVSAAFNTVPLQNLFRKVYILIHVNYNCHQVGCPSRAKIERLATGTYEYSPRPCCILRRMFRDVPGMLENEYTRAHAY